MAKRYVCEDCGYEWESRKRFGDPAICPRCNSRSIVKSNFFGLFHSFKREQDKFNEKVARYKEIVEKQCRHCGKDLRKTTPFAHCSNFWCGKPLCKECTKKCKRCGKYYCPKHIKTHNCK